MKYEIELQHITDSSLSRPTGLYLCNGCLYVSTFDGAIPLYVGSTDRFCIKPLGENKDSISQDLFLKTLSVALNPQMAKELTK